MNQDQMLSLLRTILQIIGTSIVAHGTMGINGAMWEQISGVVIILAPTVWSMYAHTDTAKLKAVEAMPAVTKITVAPTTADATAAAAADPSRPKVST